MNRRIFSRAGVGIIPAMLAGSTKAEDEKTHRLALQVSSEDRRAQQLVLGNAHNYAVFYKARNELFAIEIVAFGPGFAMVRADISMMKGEIENLQQALGGALALTACHNTRAAIAESEGKKPGDIPLLPGVEETPSGVVRLAERQEQGWAYLRP